MSYVSWLWGPWYSSRVEQYILQPQCQPRTIVVQCAGNDIERRRSDHVIVQYEMLINDITRMYPGVAVLLCKVTPRGIDHVLQHRIDMFNEYLTNRGSRVDNVWCIDARPTRFNAYCDDLTHFNRRGITRDCPEPCGTVKWHLKNNRILCLNCGARSPSLAQPSGIVTS